MSKNVYQCRPARPRLHPRHNHYPRDLPDILSQYTVNRAIIINITLFPMFNSDLEKGVLL